MHKLRLPLLLALLAAALAAPAAADAARRQFSILQDDAVFLNGSHGHPDRWVREARELGVEVIRVNVAWDHVAPALRARRKPAGHVVADPDSPGYSWGALDRFMESARRHDMKVLLSPTGPFPRWASLVPRRRCGRWCSYRPRPELFGRFVAAVAKRYRGQVALWSIWNEPNLGAWLSPQFRRRGGVRIHFGARMYRRLWREGWRAIGRHDPRRRWSVLFGETAATHNPIRFLAAALCLGPDGESLRGRERVAQRCRRRPRRLPIAGIAHHPYNQGARGTTRSGHGSRYSAAVGNTWRIHDLVDAAVRHRRMSSRLVYMTEYGFQSRPPEPRGLRPHRHARVLNESDRLFWGDPRVRAVAQYELVDPDTRRVFNTGLRYASLRRKPAWRAYRLSLVVTRLRRGVEVWGEARPARGRTVVVIEARRPRGRWHRVRRGRTNPRGFFRVRFPDPDTKRMRWRVRWRSPDGEVHASRVAYPRRPVRYRRPR